MPYLMFYEFVNTLEEIKRNERLDLKKIVFKREFGKWKEKNGEEDAITALKFMACSRNEEVKLGIGTEKISHVAARVMKTTPDQVRMKFGTSDSDKISTHFAKLLQPIRSKNDPSEQLTLKEAYDAVVEMKNIPYEKISTVLSKLVKQCSEKELKWIIAIMIRDVEGVMKFSASNIISFAKEDGNQTWINTRDLNQMFEMVEIGDDHLWQNFKPMLLSRPKDRYKWWSEVEKHCGKDFLMELKYDGEHVIMHKAGERFKWITRNGMDFSANYNMNISTRIRDFFKQTVDSCILDCELVKYSIKERKIIRHQEKNDDGSTQSFRKITGNQDVVLAVIVFDVVYLNGEPLFEKPLVERKEILTRKILERQADDAIRIATWKTASTKHEVKDYFHKAMQNDEEGIVVKRRDSLYLKGSRDSRNGLYKLKPSLSPDVDLDLVAVGICQKKDGPSVMLAAKNKEDPTDVDFTVVKGIPLHMGLSRMLRDKFKQHCGKLLTKSPPNLFLRKASPSKTMKIGFIDPEKWVVFQIRTNGVNEGKLVNAVLYKWRDDKEAVEADLLAVYRNYAKKIRNCKLPEEDDRPYWDKPARAKREALSKRSIAENHSCIEVKKIRLGSMASPIYGRKIYVRHGGGEMRNKLVDILSKFGALVFAEPTTNDGSRVDLMISTVNSGKAFAAEKAKVPDLTILHHPWVERCHKAQAIVQWDEEEELLQQGDLKWTDLKVPEDAACASTEGDTGQSTQNDPDMEEAEGWHFRLYLNYRT
ncbi:hypothetical protein WR25_06603 [Diploscapter pachys]|uniref:DNA ligase IV n=1 Tax=Diploscapter pachys TaxID=2018661 RepID=A0A2A2KT11_9BILA|nr:hypothetical protein WR25_06603 [Diploscapter pachys]